MRKRFKCMAKKKIVTSVLVGAISVASLGIGATYVQGAINGEKTVKKVNREAYSAYPQVDKENISKLNKDGYEKQTVEKFNKQVDKIFDDVGLYVQSLSEKELKKAFNQSLKYSFNELQFAKDGEDKADLGITVGVEKNVDTNKYYGAFIDYALKWKVNNKAKITVKERDDVLNQYQSSVKQILEGKTKDELATKSAKTKIISELNQLSEKLSTQDITVSAAVNDYQFLK
jgi:hypothetical protein